MDYFSLTFPLWLVSFKILTTGFRLYWRSTAAIHWILQWPGV